MHKENIFDLFNAQHVNDTPADPVPAEVVTPEQVKEEVVTPEDPAPEPQTPAAAPEEQPAGEEGGEDV